MEALPDELHLIIFSSLNQKDIPSITRTSKRWQMLMGNNQLWKGYAKRALLIMKGDVSQKRDYKALLIEHSISSFTDLGTLNGGSSCWATAINSNGSVIVGYAMDRAAQDIVRAFRWTAERGMESLGSLNGGSGSYAQGISSNGTVIFGYAKDGAEQNQERAFRWTAERGMESIDKMFADKGLLPADWTLTKVKAITTSGTVLIGEGKCNNGRTRYWRAVVPRKNLF